MKQLRMKWLIIALFCLAITVGSCGTSDSTTDTTTTGSLTTGLKLVTDSSNDVYVTGHTYADLNTNTIIGEADIFLIKYSSSGTQLWSTLSGSTVNDFVQGLAITSTNQVLRAGYTYGTLTNNSSAGGVDMLLIKTAADGSMLWEKQFGTAVDDYAYGVTADSSGDIYVIGHTYGSFAGTLTGTKDLLLVKLDSSGNQIWARQLSNDEGSGYTAASGAYGIAVKTDSAGNVYGAGFTSGAFSGNSSSGNFDLFVLKYDTAGNLAWIKQLGTTANDYIRDLQVSAAGDVYLTGYTQGALEGQTLAGETDIFLTKLNTSGVIQWIRQVGTEENDSASGIALDSSGDAYLTGYTSGSLIGDNLGGSDFLIMKYDATGDVSWQKQLGTTSTDITRSIAIDSANYFYLTGYTYGPLDAISNDDLVYTSFLSRYDATGTLSWTKSF